jgi:hypothetical protein
LKGEAASHLPLLLDTASWLVAMLSTPRLATCRRLTRVRPRHPAPATQRPSDTGTTWTAARILVKNSRMCRTGVPKDPGTPRRLWP